MGAMPACALPDAAWPQWLGTLPALPGAACATSTLGPGAWFSQNLGQIQAAQRVCSACVARPECLQFALDERITVGVWGGTTPAQRGRPRRIRHPAG
jgi:Transcription factor WhiB